MKTFEQDLVFALQNPYGFTHTGYIGVQPPEPYCQRAKFKGNIDDNGCKVKTFFLAASCNPPLYPHQKPLSLMERLIRIYSSPDALVVDPFVGTGTTLLAAINTGRRAIGIEADKKQCALVVKRLAACR